jgi:hypothetical protein
MALPRQQPTWTTPFPIEQSSQAWELEFEDNSRLFGGLNSLLTGDNNELF